MWCGGAFVGVVSRANVSVARRRMFEMIFVKRLCHCLYRGWEMCPKCLSSDFDSDAVAKVLLVRKVRTALRLWLGADWEGPQDC